MPLRDPPSPSTCLCVLGMHRSGTSAAARVLNLLGVELGERLLGASVDNPKGFWEHEQIVEAHERLFDALDVAYDDFFPLPDGWESRPAAAELFEGLAAIVDRDFAAAPLWGFKDPRACRTLPVWRHVLAARGASPRALFVVRSPDAIARSLAVRDGLSYNRALLLTLAYLCEAEACTRDWPRVVVAYDDLMNDWRAAAARAGAALGIDWPVAADDAAAEIDAFLDRGLRHHGGGGGAAVDPRADADARRWVEEAHAMWTAAAAGAAIDPAVTDRVYAAFNGELPRLAGWRESKSAARQRDKFEAWGKNLDAAYRALRREHDRLRAATGDVELTLADATARTASPAEAGAPDDAEGAAGAESGAAEQEERAALSARALAAETRARAAELERRRHEDAARAARAELAAAGIDAERLRWLESHAARVEAHVANLQAHAAGLEAANRDLAEGNRWLAAERAKADEELARHREELDRLRAWAAELQSGNAWLMAEVEKAKAGSNTNSNTQIPMTNQ